MINRAFCFVGEKNGVKYLKIAKGNKKLEDSILTIWNQVFSVIRYNIKKTNQECKELAECKGYPEYEEFDKCIVNYGEDFDKIKFVSNDNLPLGKLIYFPTLAVTIRCVLNDKFISLFRRIFVPIINDILREN